MSNSRILPNPALDWDLSFFDHEELIGEEPRKPKETKRDENKKDRMITVRMTISERDEINRQCQKLKISLNDYCRSLLGLSADVSPRKTRRGNPSWITLR